MFASQRRILPDYDDDQWLGYVQHLSAGYLSLGDDGHLMDDDGLLDAFGVCQRPGCGQFLGRRREVVGRGSSRRRLNLCARCLATCSRNLSRWLTLCCFGGKVGDLTRYNLVVM